jgi:hypothetical protein
LKDKDIGTGFSPSDKVTAQALVQGGAKNATGPVKNVTQKCKKMQKKMQENTKNASRSNDPYCSPPVSFFNFLCILGFLGNFSITLKKKNEK